MAKPKLGNVIDVSLESGKTQRDLVDIAITSWIGFLVGTYPSIKIKLETRDHFGVILKGLFSKNIEIIRG